MIHDKNGQYTEEARKASSEIREKCMQVAEICTAHGFNMAETLYLINSEVQLKLLHDIIMNRKKENKRGDV